ncbi:sodium/glutamate symporter [Pseudonocardia nantongensis]|uniref:sodium/glutamate symporter n=1 Tax=Pseudonocardia nantongensis TaxID=1181885 RepID=UPI0039782967
MDYGPWLLVVDAGMIGGLLLVGTLVRRWVESAQRLMLPASVVAGFLGLLLGPQVLGVLPFSDQLGTYASVLIAVVFACLGLGDDPGSRGFGRSTAAFSAYSFATYALQVGLGMVLAYALFVPVFGTPDGFGLLLFAGWAGGFGSAAAVGSVLGEAGWEGASSLAFTSATVGMLAGVLGGIAIANWGARRGHTGRLGRFDELPTTLRTGLVPPGDREPTGVATTSASSIEPLGLQVCLVAVITVLGYGAAEGVELLVPSFSAPVFVLAFLAGLLIKALARRTPAWQYCDQRTLKSISGVSTDLLIVCGIASIAPSLVADYWLPLTLLFLAALAVNLAMFRWIAPAVMHGAWFEKSLFTWGWATGAVATSVALLRMVDPDLDSRTLEEFGLAYLPVAPLETGSIAVAPLLVLAGLGWTVAVGWTVAGLVALVLPFVFGWTRTRAGRPDPTPERST